NQSCHATVLNTSCCNSCAYIISATCMLCLACKSQMLSNMPLLSLLNLLSLPMSFPNALFKYWFEIAIAICLYMLMPTCAFRYCLLCCCIICCIWSSVYFCF
ncbi:hypothetical protein QBC33DRAFT_462534, partial [Phialemonium atrogriseum]